MNILVIGNGFDLAHGLPTRYYDFIKFVKLVQKIDGKAKYERDSIIKDTKIYTVQEYKMNENILERLLDDSIYENKYFKEFISCIKENGWIEYFKDRAKVQNTWVDFEMSIKELIKIFDAIIRNDEKELARIEIEAADIRHVMREFTEEDKRVYTYTHVKFENLKEILSSKFIEALEGDLKRVIRALEIYIALFIEKIDSSGYKGIIENIDEVISFNYSNTFEGLYGTPNIKYDYIHGKANLECDINKNNMVLGIDEYLDDDIKDKNLEFIFFKKYFQRIFKRTGCSYKKILELGTAANVYFYGHSLSRADKDILQEIIEGKRTRITIYYHNDDAYRSQITNLVDIIGQDKLIEMVYGKNPEIVFKSIEGKENVEIIGDKKKNLSL